MLSMVYRLTPHTLRRLRPQEWPLPKPDNDRSMYSRHASPLCHSNVAQTLRSFYVGGQKSGKRPRTAKIISKVTPNMIGYTSLQVSPCFLFLNCRVLIYLKVFHALSPAHIWTDDCYGFEKMRHFVEIMRLFQEKTDPWVKSTLAYLSECVTKTRSRIEYSQLPKRQLYGLPRPVVRTGSSASRILKHQATRQIAQQPSQEPTTPPSPMQVHDEAPVAPPQVPEPVVISSAGTASDNPPSMESELSDLEPNNAPANKRKRGAISGGPSGQTGSRTKHTESLSKPPTTTITTRATGKKTRQKSRPS
jgi:hypothetical protein